MHDYSITHRQKRGNIDQNKTLRTKCKVATFRGVVDDGERTEPDTELRTN